MDWYKDFDELQPLLAGSAGSVGTALLLLVLLAACRSEETRSTPVLLEGEPAAYQEELERPANLLQEQAAATAKAKGPLALLELFTTWDTAGYFHTPAYIRAYDEMVCWLPAEDCTVDEPGWDMAVVVTDYSINIIAQSADSAYAEVTYGVLAIAFSNQLIPVDSALERRIWKITGPVFVWGVALKRLTGGWRIVGVESMKPPFISAHVALGRMRSAADSTALKALAARRGIPL